MNVLIKQSSGVESPDPRATNELWLGKVRLRYVMLCLVSFDEFVIRQVCLFDEFVI